MITRFLNKTKEMFNEEFTPQVAILVKNYYIAIDRALSVAEENRQAKTGSYQDPVSVIWNNVDIERCIQDSVFNARLGLDPLQSNFVFAMPVKNKKDLKYKIDLRIGYNGRRFLAYKYALKPFVNVITELIYNTDKFNIIKRDLNNPVENYTLEVTAPFERGDIAGGFSYVQYENPHFNKLIVLSTKDIEKRKPKFASANFWGGEADQWIEGKKQKVAVEGWEEEMFIKTILNETFKPRNIPIDPTLIKLFETDKCFEFESKQETLKEIIKQEANVIPIDIDEDF